MVEDLFKAAGIDPTSERSRGGNRRSNQPDASGYEDEDTTDGFGGHNLRQVLPGKTLADGTSVIPRPRSRLTSATAQKTLNELVSEDATDTTYHPRRAESSKRTHDEDYDDYDDYDEEEEEDMDDNEENSGYDDDSADITPRTKGARFTSPTPTERLQLTYLPRNQTQPAQPIPLTTVKLHSELGRAAAIAFSTSGFNLARELGWQAAVKGDSAKIKLFRQEVTQQVDVTPFGFMRPASPFIQVIHSIATYAVRGGTSDLQNMDFGFIGDRTDFKIPTPVALDDKLWKWEKKTMGLDVPPLEQYYSNPNNAKVLYHDDASGGEKTVVPRMLYLPPPFLVYCLEAQRTPFELHQFIARFATQAGSGITIMECETMMDWCFMAAHRAAAGTPTTSMLAISLPAAPSDDDDFLRWLFKVDCTRTAASTQPTPSAAHPLAPPAPAATARHATIAATTSATTTAPPGPDVWDRMARSITNSFASAAAALKPPPADPDDTSYESGGLPYDSFQLATLKGFAHVPDITGVPLIWALFQYTKNMETHKDNIRRRMLEWAAHPSRPAVQIERSLYIPKSTLKEILTLSFNPGGILAEAEEADLGISPLICRTRTIAAKTALKKYEKALDQSRRSRSMAEAEAEQNRPPAYESGALPDNYHELLCCIGTFCALLHTLFGERCAFYRQCYALWSEMTSDLVYEQREDFSALYCRQIVWAVLMESRIYFSQRLSVDDFKNVHPDDVKYPRCNLHKVVAHVRDMEPIVRSSFPAAWYPAGTGRRNPVAATSSVAPSVTAAPIQSIAAPTGGAPSVVSGITANTGRTPRPPTTIRTTDVHPRIKAAMESCIAKNKGVWLGAMLTHLNLTIDDLPTLAPDISGTSSLCYNFILGHCKMEGCQHAHVHARDLTDDFVTDLLVKLKPGIDEFTANGLPPGTRRRRRPRRGRA